jgi:hypothetical protein
MNASTLEISAVTTSEIESLAQLKALRRWVVFRAIEKSEECPNPKQPLQPNGKPASTTDPNTWSSYDAAIVAVTTGKFAGVGFVLGEGIAGIDLDDVRNAETGEIDPAAQDFIQQMSSYTEISPSGTGVHILVQANVIGAHKKLHVEIYGEKSPRYLTVTEQHLKGTPTQIQERDAELSAALAEIENIETRIASSLKAATKKKCIATRDSAKFKRLMLGDCSDYVGVSEAVAGLLVMLAAKTDCDPEKMDEQFRLSGMYADHDPHGNWTDEDKWGRLGEDEIAGAIKAYQKNAKKASDLEFTRPQVFGGTAFDFALDPLDGAPRSRGLFPRGDTSSFTGASGSCKSTKAFEWLLQQRDSQTIHGHRTHGYSFHVLMVDRGKLANERTLDAMKIDPLKFPITPMRHVIGTAALQVILEEIEKLPVIPEVVFIEGGDMLVEDASKPKDV